MGPDQSPKEIKYRIFLLSLTLAVTGTMILGLVGYAVIEKTATGSFPLVPLFIIFVLGYITTPLLRLYHEERRALKKAREREKLW